MKRVLITGKNSYVGRAIESRLLGDPASFHVDTVDVKESGWRAMDFSSYDSVFHVEGIAHVPPSSQSDGMYMAVNCDLACEVAEKAASEGVRQFIFMSSAIVYGESTVLSRQDPIDEQTLVAPENAYGRSKVEAERRLRLLSSDDFSVAILRCPMIYGPGCTRGNFPTLVRLAQASPLFPKVKNRRSMLYVENLAELVAGMILRGSAGVFLPQNAEYVSTSELVRLIAERSRRGGVVLTGLLSPLVSLLTHVHPLARKAFGNSFYAQSCGNVGFSYQKYSLEQSIDRIAEADGWLA